MQVTVPRPAEPELKELVTAASQALARLDAQRLEELVLRCQAVPRNATRAALREQALAAAQDMAVLARLLEATRANLRVMRRLRELRSEQLEYGRWGATEDGRGND